MPEKRKLESEATQEIEKIGDKLEKKKVPFELSIEDAKCYCSAPVTINNVHKDGKNKGRKFVTCALNVSDDEDWVSGCDFFKWYDEDSMRACVHCCTYKAKSKAGRFFCTNKKCSRKI